MVQQICPMEICPTVPTNLRVQLHEVEGVQGRVTRNRPRGETMVDQAVVVVREEREERETREIGEIREERDQMGIRGPDSREGRERSIESSEKGTTDSDDKSESSNIEVDEDDLLNLLNDAKLHVIMAKRQREHVQ